MSQADLPLEDLRFKDASQYLAMQRFLDTELFNNFLNSNLNEIIGPNEMITCLDEINEMIRPTQPDLLSLENTRSLDFLSIMLNNTHFSLLNPKDLEVWINNILSSLDSKMKISFVSEPFYLSFEGVKKITPVNLQKMAILRQVKILNLRGCPLGNEVIPVLALG